MAASHAFFANDTGIILTSPDKNNLIELLDDIVAYSEC
jgi:hypothetical protein